MLFTMEGVSDQIGGPVLRPYLCKYTSMVFQPWSADSLLVFSGIKSSLSNQTLLPISKVKCTARQTSGYFPLCEITFRKTFPF